MSFYDKLLEYKIKKEKCFINGMPEEDGGIIKDVLDDYLVFEITNIDEKNQANSTKETICIPLKDIVSVSKVEKLSVL